MEIKLLNITPIELIITGIRTCYQSQDKSDSYYKTIGNLISKPYNNTFIIGEKDKALIKRIIDSGHHSTLEHYIEHFEIEWEDNLEKEKILSGLLEILSETIGALITYGHESIIISLNVRTMRDSYIRTKDNYLCNILFKEFYQKCPELFEDLVKP